MVVLVSVLCFSHYLSFVLVSVLCFSLSSLCQFTASQMYQTISDISGSNTAIYIYQSTGCSFFTFCQPTASQVHRGISDNFSNIAITRTKFLMGKILTGTMHIKKAITTNTLNLKSFFLELFRFISFVCILLLLYLGRAGLCVCVCVCGGGGGGLEGGTECFVCILFL